MTASGGDSQTVAATFATLVGGTHHLVTLPSAGKRAYVGGRNDHFARNEVRDALRAARRMRHCSHAQAQPNSWPDA